MSEKLWEEAQKIFAGGVNSPVRASVKPYPFYVKGGKGPFLFTIEGRKLIDYVLAYGPLILGHAHPKVVESIKQAIEDGWIFGTPTKFEIDLAKKILKYVKMDKIRFVNSGTEATLLAIRLARAYTGRKKILKFDGNYHGAHDFLLIDAGSSASEYNVPISSGIPEEVVKLTEVCDYNDIECVEKKLKTEEFAAVIVEPIAGNFGLILPDIEFLKGLRELTKNYGSLLIFDEVITGFRLGLGGAQEYFGIRADIVTLGKIIGGGFPIGAVASKNEIIDMITPKGKVFNAGTFNAHPISMIAGLSTLEVLEKEKVYEIANNACKVITSELERLYKGDFVLNRVASMFQIFFDVKQVRNAKDVRKANREKYIKFAQELLKRDIFIPHSQFEVIFTSGVHDESVIDITINAIKEAIKNI
ncbi:MAG: glutamate-1-semialdehyde 2,1-aminomutase [Sulfolobaceae archaeon]